MRDIKFRCVDHSTNTIAYQFTKYVVCEDGTEYQFIAFNFNGKIISLSYALSHPDEYVVTQFTGLLDKNGKEIYEGDIVKTDWYGEGTNPLKYLVTFIDMRAGYEPFANPKWAERGGSSIWEIIGNKYENPSL